MRRTEIETAARRMTALVAAVDEADLGRATPCSEYTVAALLDHIDGFVTAFTAAGTRTDTRADGPPGAGDARHLRADWDAALPAGLDALVGAWQDDDAYDGMLTAGGITMPADSVAVVAIEELVVHGWDLARATGRSYDCTGAELAVIDDFFGQFGPEQRGDAYGPERDAPGGASALARAIARSGRDPEWTADR